MRKLLAASGVVLLTQFGVAHAAGPFDGAWSGEAVGSGTSKACNAVVTGTVTNNVLHGVMKWGKFAPTDFGGAIAPDGSFKARPAKLPGHSRVARSPAASRCRTATAIPTNSP